MDPGELWAYRARQTDPLVEVQVLRVGTKRPARVLVRFVADESEGREEWVPPNRLKVLWDQAEGFRAREERWARVSSFGPDRQDAVWDAADHVVRLAFGDEVLFPYDDGGVLQIEDPTGVAASLGLELSHLVSHPASFSDGRALVVPWPVTELLATSAPRNARRSRRPCTAVPTGLAAMIGTSQSQKTVSSLTISTAGPCAPSCGSGVGPMQSTGLTNLGSSGSRSVGSGLSPRPPSMRCEHVARIKGRQPCSVSLGFRSKCCAPQCDLRSQSGGPQALRPRGMNLSRSDGLISGRTSRSSSG